MATIQPTSENKSVMYTPDSIVMPCAAGTVINQGSRVKIVSNLIVPTAAATDDFVGVADFQNPVASLGDQLTAGKVLLKDNVVMFDAPASETFTFGDLCYAYDNGGNSYPGAVTKSTSGSPKLVGTFVGLTAVTGGSTSRVAVKIVPTVVI